MDDLQRRFPLPLSLGNPLQGGRGGRGSAEDGPAANRELRARCEALGLPSGRYSAAIRALAAYEMRVFFLLCAYVAGDRRLRVLRLDENGIGEDPHDLAPTHALARAIEANEGLRVLQLCGNRLGAAGVGVIAKALTRNIALVEVDLSENELNLDALEEAEEEQLQREAEDPVFGPFYRGLEAISEVIKKNKFLRILRLCRNGIHAGESLALGAPDDNNDEAEAESAGESPSAPPPLLKSPTSSHASRTSGAPPPTPAHSTTLDYRLPLPDGEAYEALTGPWQDLPLWRLVEPLRRYHKLEVLDLAGNQLRGGGTRMLALALAQNRSLRVLDLTDNEVDYNGLRYLASWALSSRESALHTLILRRNALAGEKPGSSRRPRAPKPQALAAMTAFAQAMRGNRRIRRLVLSDNHLGPALSARLLATIAHAEALEELDFANNDACGRHPGALDTTAARHLALALTRRRGGGGGPPSSSASSSSACGSLVKLNFRGNNLCAGGLEALLSPPPHGNSAEKDELDGDGDPSPAELPPVSWTLRELDLSRNSLGDALGPLGRLFAIPPPPPPSEGENAADGPTPASITTFASSLISLNISHNEITSLQELTPGLLAGAANHSASSPFALASLDLSHNRLGCDEGGLALEVPRRPTGLSPPPADARWGQWRGGDSPGEVLAIREGAAVRGAQQRHLAGFIEGCAALAALPGLAELDLGWNQLRRVHGEVLYRLLTFPSSAPSPSPSPSPPPAFPPSSPVAGLVDAALGEAPARPFRGLRALDLSRNGLLPGPREVRGVLDALAGRPGLAVVYLSPEEGGGSLSDAREVLGAILAAARASDALQDVRAGLVGLDAIRSDANEKAGEANEEEEEEEEGADETRATIAAIRERLLLNALLQADARDER